MEVLNFCKKIGNNKFAIKQRPFNLFSW